MALTTEQTLLLNNLMYLESAGGSPFQGANRFEGQTIGEWLDSIDLSRVDPSKDYGSFMTGEDWTNIIQAVQQDETLRNMRIAETHVDSGGGEGRSAVFLSEETGDALVVFKGTESSKEWIDNFEGGNVTDTAYQQNALEWYQEVYQEYGLENYEVTLSGHSKGGNKAKYITILDDTVDHCVSFDGQGFSDKFMEKYQNEIAARQNKVENHNVDYDYVNFLLNDIGDSTYYDGQDYGDGGFLENHCPNTFLKFQEDGSFSMEISPNGQAEEIQALDEFLNNMLRSMSDSERDGMLMMVNDVLNEAFSFDGTESTTDIINTFLDMAADPQYADSLAYLVAYTIEYEQTNPELVEKINQVLEEFGMGGVTEYVDMADAILNYEGELDLGILGTYPIDFDTIYDILNGTANVVSWITPDWLWSFLLGWVKDKWGIDLTQEELMNLLHVVGEINQDMEDIKIQDNGGDIEVDPVVIAPGGSDCRYTIRIPAAQQEAESIQRFAQTLEQCAADVMQEAGRLSFESWNAVIIYQKLWNLHKKLEQNVKRTQHMGATLAEIVQCYEQAENQNLNKLG